MATPAIPAEASSGRQVHAQRGQELESNDGADDGQPGGAKDAGQGLDLGDAARPGAVVLGNAHHAARAHAQQLVQQQADNRDADEMGQLVDDLLAVGDPLVEYFTHELVFAEQHPHGFRRQFDHAKLL